ncbi:DUF2059 domain-containing protein [Actibacterium lipolyticum]|nr:DUF2059 domain-containing protein [Actibacterium lipolyticum]
MFKPFILFFAAAVFASPLSAEPSPKLVELVDALRLSDSLEIMVQEGTAYGDEIEAEMFAERGGARWQAMVASVYDLERMEDLMVGVLEDELDSADLDPLIEFFSSERGVKIVELEIAARRAMLDDGVDEAGRDRLARMRSEGDPRLDVLKEFEAVNELISWNVAGGLNANFAFFQGLVDGGAFPFEVTEEQMLADVWSQEEDLRAETADWLFSYLAFAYQPLNDADLRAYIDASATKEGRALNVAMFEGFDIVFRTISRELGLGAAQFIAGQDI